MFTTHQIAGWNPTPKNGDEWGMVCDIALLAIAIDTSAIRPNEIGVINQLNAI